MFQNSFFNIFLNNSPKGIIKGMCVAISIQMTIIDGINFVKMSVNYKSRKLIIISKFKYKDK